MSTTTGLTRFHLSATTSPEAEPALLAAFGKQLRPLLEGQDLRLDSAVWRMTGESIVGWGESTTTGHHEPLHAVARTIATTFPSPVRVILTEHPVTGDFGVDYTSGLQTVYRVEGEDLVIETTTLSSGAAQVDRVPLAVPFQLPGSRREVDGVEQRVRDFIDAWRNYADGSATIEWAADPNSRFFGVLALDEPDIRDLLNELDDVRQRLEDYERDERARRADRNYEGE